MELFNSLSPEREQDIADFLTFIPIYSSKRRINAYYSLLKKFERQIQGHTCCEAGAGRGLISKKMAEMGADMVYAVERSGVLFELLEETIMDAPRVQCVEEDIEFWEPPEDIHTLIHEFYGPLVLDESILALKKLTFSPDLILPDGGRLWAMPISRSQAAELEPLYQDSWYDALDGALVSDLLEKIQFQPTWEVFNWSLRDDRHSFRFVVPEECDFLAFCGEITHEGKSVLKMWWTNNWPVIFTPASGKACEFRFAYEDGYTNVYFDWVD